VPDGPFFTLRNEFKANTYPIISIGDQDGLERNIC